MDKATFKYITESNHSKHKLTIKNIKAISVSEDLFTAFNEWHVDHPLPAPPDLSTDIAHCQFCHTKIEYPFPAVNSVTGKTKIIGSKCLTYYSRNYQNGELLTPKEAEKLHDKKIQEIKAYRRNPKAYELKQRQIKEAHEKRQRQEAQQQKFKEARLKREAREKEQKRQFETAQLKIKKEYEALIAKQQQHHAHELLKLGQNRELWENIYYYLQNTYGEKYQKEVAQIAKKLFHKK